MKLQGRTQPLFNKYSSLDALDVIKRLGFDGVEFCLENEDMAPDTLTDARVAEVKAKIQALGLTPYSISYHVNYIYDDALFELTKQAIRWTPAFGTDILVFSGFFPKEGDTQAWETTVKRTRILADIAEECGVRLAQEFEPNFVVGSTEQLLQLFEEVNSPNLLANMDLGHVFLCDPDPVAAIHAVGDKIIHGHVENMATGVHNHLLPQEGDMDLGVYITALKDVGFTGGLSLDLYAQDYEAVSPDAIAFLRGLIG